MVYVIVDSLSGYHVDAVVYESDSDAASRIEDLIATAADSAYTRRNYKVQPFEFVKDSMRC